MGKSRSNRTTTQHITTKQHPIHSVKGTIGLSVARSVKRVVGIEMVEAAVVDARLNAELNGDVLFCCVCFELWCVVLNSNIMLVLTCVYWER